MNKTYFAYIRVSTVKQGERGSSLLEQKSAIEAYAARNNLTVLGWYEEMETAAKQGRRQFAQMMAALVANKAHGVIIHKIDRSARNLRDWANLGDLIDRGVDVRFVTDNFDLLSRGGRLSADIQAVVAADFIRNLRDEVRKGMYGRLKQGLYPWRAPSGYLDTGKGNPKIIDPVKGPLVRLMFERYATNTLGLHAVRREMYEKGLRTETGKMLSVNGVDCILNNPFYMGVIRITAIPNALKRVSALPEARPPRDRCAISSLVRMAIDMSDYLVETVADTLQLIREYLQRLVHLLQLVEHEVAKPRNKYLLAHFLEFGVCHRALSCARRKQAIGDEISPAEMH